MKKLLLLSLITTLCIFSTTLSAQDEKKEATEGYKFEFVKKIPVTNIRNQARTSTCWSFSTLGLMEAELIKQGKGEIDLSEMFIVRHTYAEKAEKYMRFDGNLNLSGGGGFSDIPHIMNRYGLVPESAFDGLVIGENRHMHGEMDLVIKSYCEAVHKNKNGKLSPVWLETVNDILENYLGAYPNTFTYEDKEYTPKSFAEELGLKENDFVEITSYNHHPFYEAFILEIPDNWMLSNSYNVPLEEMTEIIDYAIENGHAVAWGGDISNKGFNWKNGVAIVPAATLEDISGTDRERWESLSSSDIKKSMYDFSSPVPEKRITQEERQKAFDNYTSTDDHGVLICGSAKDQNGTSYYYVKNSWGNSNHVYDGFFYMSKPFSELNATGVMVHKDAIPKKIRKKLGL